MLKNFKYYISLINIHYKIIYVFYITFLNGEEKERAFLNMKKAALKSNHCAYSKISPERFKKYRAKLDDKVQELYEMQALTQQEYETEKQYMEYCNNYTQE